jgi:N-methylhydantoinase A
VDEAGALRAGPRSAGAEPGPAAFGRGGTEATVTDAHLLLGHLGAERMSGGVRLDAAAAARALHALAARLPGGVDAPRVARAMLAAADAAMARALRRVSVERGLDPRTMVLVAFGGGGPLHACGLAERLGMTRVLVPPYAGVLSAVGLAAAPERREALTSVMRTAAELDAPAVHALVDALARRAGRGVERRSWVRARYAGQGHELEVPVQDGDDGEALATRFATLHLRRVGFTLPRAVEIVSARHAASTPGPSPRFARGGTIGDRSRRDDGTTLVHDAGGAAPSHLEGPATIVLPDATVLLPVGWTARALEIGGWMLEAA